MNHWLHVKSEVGRAALNQICEVMPWAFVFILAVCFKTLSLFSTPSLFLARPAVCSILVPWPGIEPMYPAMEGWSPNHWRAGDVPTPSFLPSYYPNARELILGAGSVTSLQGLTWPCSRPLFFSPPLLLCFTISSLISFPFSVPFSSPCRPFSFCTLLFISSCPFSLPSVSLSFLISSPPPSLHSFSLPSFLPLSEHLLGV